MSKICARAALDRMVSDVIWITHECISRTSTQLFTLYIDVYVSVQCTYYIMYLFLGIYTR